jgi:glucose-6-phosphate 1-dehydrogenase
MANNKETDIPSGISSIVEGHTIAETPPDSCLILAPSDPCTFVIIGASGDLTTRKLIPALYELFRKGGLPDRFQVVGCGRTAITDDEFRAKVAPQDRGDDAGPDQWDGFSERLYYRTIDYDSLDSYTDLAARLRELDSAGQTGGNRIFYLALPMFLYGTTPA